MSRQSKPSKSRSEAAPAAGAPAAPSLADPGCSSLGVAAVAFVVFLAAFAACWPALSNGFVDWDDPGNFLTNSDYRGLGLAQLRWMFTTFHYGHYQPLTWLSHGLNFVVGRAMFGDGMDPRPYHFTNNLLHAINAALVLLLARRLLAIALPPVAPRRILAAAAVAALVWGLHPMRVEPVAWVTERRDVLSAFFFLLALLAYLRAQVPGARYGRWFGLAVLLYVCCLLSKVIAVTLPFVFVILDAYPLRRFSTSASVPGRPDLRRALIEKVPLLALSLGFGLIAAIGQNRANWLIPLSIHPLPARIATCFYGLWFYLWKAMLPIGLNPLYALPTPMDIMTFRFIAPAVMTFLAAAALLLSKRRWPASLYAAAAFYLLLIAPVLGILQNGPQLVADRYCYLAHIGWIVWLAGAGVAWLCRSQVRSAALATAASIVLCATLAGLTWRQTKVWNSTASLWSYAYHLDPDSSYAANSYGYVLLSAGRVEESIPLFRDAIRLNPRLNSRAYNNLCTALDRAGKLEEALAARVESLKYLPNEERADAYNSMGDLLLRLNRSDEAESPLKLAVGINPRHARALGNLGVVLIRKNDFDAAIPLLERAVAASPDLAPAHFNLASALRAKGRTAEAVKQYREVLRINPAHEKAHKALEQLAPQSHP